MPDCAYRCISDKTSEAFRQIMRNECYLYTSGKTVIQNVYVLGPILIINLIDCCVKKNNLKSYQKLYVTLLLLIKIVSSEIVSDL